MLVSVRGLYGKPVVTSDGRKLGSVVNVLVHTLTLEASVVVFPRVAPRWMMNRAGMVVGPAVGQLFGLLKKVFDAEVVEAALDEMSSRVGGRMSDKAAKVLERRGKLYYLIPLSFVSEFRTASIHLSIGVEECKEWYRNVMVPPETDAPVFEAMYYRGPSRPITVSLGMSALREFAVKGETGATTKVIDVQVDTVSRRAAAVEVLDGPEGASGRLIGADRLRFEGNVIVFPGSLESYPPAEAHPLTPERR
jgi:hypothetical protein